MVNDNCHALGSSLKKDQGYAVRFADFVTLSFHPVKHITTGEGVLVCNGEEYPIKEGDCILVPANHRHQFINIGEKNLERVTVNPRNSVEN